VGISRLTAHSAKPANDCAIGTYGKWLTFFRLQRDIRPASRPIGLLAEKGLFVFLLLG